MLKVHNKEIPAGKFKVTFIPRVAQSLPFQLCFLGSKFSVSFSQSLNLELQPGALDSHLPTGKLSAINDSVI